MAEIDNLELAKRNMFKGLDRDQYQELVDYQKDFTGIEPLNVNRGVTAADVLRATGPLSQPVAPGLTSSVAQFNDFLANILGAKSQRIATEEGIGAEQDAAARAAVDASLAKPPPNEKDNYMVVNNQLVDVRTLDDDNPRTIDLRDEVAPIYKVINNQLVNADSGAVIGDFRDKEKNYEIINNQLIDVDTMEVLGDFRNEENTKEIINNQLVNTDSGEVIGDYRDTDEFENLKVINNQLVDLTSKQVVGDFRDEEAEELAPRFVQFGDYLYDMDLLKENPNDLEGARVPTKFPTETKPSNAARVGELKALKDEAEKNNEEFPLQLQAELDYLTKPEVRPYVSPYEEKFVGLIFDKNKSAEAAQQSYSAILDAEKQLNDPKFVTGTGTNTLLGVQKFFEDIIGLDLDEILEGFNIDILNNPGDTETFNKATNQLVLNILGSGKIPGSISNFEFKQMLISVFNSDSTEEANNRFIKGMKYLYEKEIAAADIISTIDYRNNPTALEEYREKIRSYDDEQRPKFFPDANYLENITSNFPAEKEG